ncbi:MAG: filament integrity protein fraC [Rhizonema sp. PD37]|nr:filament integrity protein fraC [Rhizonema sp. PD37]
MPEFHFLPRIFPLGAILFNFLFLLVATPLEAYVLNARLKFDKKTSAFYSICINLFSNVIGWIIFFSVESVLPVVPFKSELINYFFYNRLQSNKTQSVIILTAFVIFFTTFLVKYICLKGLFISLSEPGKNDESKPIIRRNSRRAYKNRWQNTNLVTTVLIGNALSYSVIAVILFVRAAYP